MGNANNAAPMDSRKVMTGKDGRIYLEVDGVSQFYAECDAFNVVMNVSNVDIQPIGHIMQFAVNTGVNYAITLSEMVVRDDFIALPIQDAIAKGKMPTFTFQAGAERWDGEEQLVTLRRCTPDGTVGILNLTPGEVIKREMSFRINDIPEWIKRLPYDLSE